MPIVVLAVVVAGPVPGQDVGTAGRQGESAADRPSMDADRTGMGLSPPEARRLHFLEAAYDRSRKAGRYREATPLARDILAIRRRALGEGHPETATSYTNLAALLEYQGKYAEAEPLYQKALAIRRRVFGEAHPETATRYNNLATSLKAQGKLAEAEPLAWKALEIRRRVRGEDHPERAISYNNLATILKAQGKLAEAEPLFRNALAVHRRVLGEDHATTAVSYNNLAELLREQGKYAAAEPLHRKALEIRRRVLGEDHATTAVSYNNLAVLLQAQGKLAAAEPLLQKTLAISRRILGEDHPDTAVRYNNLALLLQAQGKLAEAEPVLQKALAIQRRVLGENHPDTARAYSSLAFGLQAEGKYAEAEAMWTEAARSYEAARRPISHTGLERIAFAAERSPLPHLAALLVRRGQPSRAWERLEADLARGLFDDLARPLEPQEQRREQELRARLQQLEDEIVSLTTSRSRDPRLGAQWDSLWRSREAIRAGLSAFEGEVDRKYGAAAGRPYELAQIQGQLPADTALVAWIDIKGHPRAADPDGDHWACLVRSQGEPIWVKVGGGGPDGVWTSDDDRLLREAAAQLRVPAGRSAAPWKPAAGTLAARRLDPLDGPLGPHDGLPRVTNLIILTSPKLAGVPIEALVEARPPDRPRYTVSYAPSGTMFAWLRARPRPDRKPGDVPRRLLALGDPQFDEALLKARGTPLPPLPGSRREVEALARLFEQSQTLIGADASEERLDALAAADQLRGFDVLHLSTHGAANPRLPMHSALLLAGDTRSDASERVLRDLPVYDGVLTAAQILRTWKLDADLVTLSACETGLGRQSGGEGYLGFAQALFLAGARSLVLSLWKVDDTATSLLMTRFYENLLGKRAGLDRPMPKAEALREAKQWLRGLTDEQAETALSSLERGNVRPLSAAPGSPRPPSALLPTTAPRRFEHPYYWAAFILVGDPF
jgi:CHAT domain-containing protein/tetratricopeptide (TPR) repeat protein